MDAVSISLFGVMLLGFSLLTHVLMQPQETTAEFLKRRMVSKAGKRTGSLLEQLLLLPMQFYKTVSPNFLRMAKNLYASNTGYMGKTRKLLITANAYKDDGDVFQHFAFSLFVACLGIVAGLAAMMLLPVAFLYKVMALLICILVGRFVPDFLLRSKASARKMEIYYTMSDVLDLLVVCMESGLGMDSSIVRVSQETGKLAPDLTDEMNKLMFEVSSGISRAEAFKNMANRTDVPELATLAAMLIQADKFGTPLGNTLKVFSDDLRRKRRMKAEELASKASIKMTFPLVLLIFPPLFMILLGPSVITALDLFGKK
jgi:tight adherence protein C